MQGMTAIFLLISVVIFKAPVQALGQIQEKTGIRLTPFQKNIQTCLQSNEAVSKIQTLSDLYDVLDKAYPLRTSETVFREILFRKDDEIRKIKFEKGKVRLFKVSDDKSIKLINSDARQKVLTEESSINELLVGAEV